MSALNNLIAANRLLVSTNERGVPVYRYQSEENAQRMREMDPEDFMVFERIEESRDKGVTAIDLKNKLQAYGATTASLNKVLKRLEKKGIIKKLKSLQQKGRQVFMLMEVEPAAEVTAGLVNTDSFDLEVIEVVQQRVLEYLRAHGSTSYREIALHVKQTGLLQAGQEYKEEHIRQIVQVLVFD